MAGFLTTVQREQYGQDGFVFPLPVLSSEEAKRFRSACDDLERSLGGKPRTIAVRQMHLHFAWAWQLATHPRILDAVEGILGPNLMVWATELFAKHARDGTLTIGWHRDRPYMGFAAEQTATAWVALSPSTQANGCMCVLPRSRDGLKSALGTPGQDIPEGDIEAVVLKPGEMSLHGPEILHGSSANTSGEKRVGFVIRFITPAARPLTGEPSVALVRGKDAYGHFQLVEPPAGGSQTDPLAAMASSATEHLDLVLENLRLHKGMRGIKG